ncbi:MAG: class I adenylate-forming enzyme family protein [Planctomycetota bacterium]|jgi:acyl-CoA synthetase (AMP-forming)/AMP-acid ligase II
MEHLIDVWRECVERFPRKTGVIAEGKPHDYASLEERVSSLAGALSARFGVKRGERVIVRMKNSLPFFLAYWATLRLGAAVAAVGPRLSPREAAGVIRALSSDGGGRVLLLDTGTEHPEKAMSGVEHVLDAEEIVALADSGERAPGGAAIEGADLAVLAHTSGTTGAPKIAQVSHADLLFNLKIACLALSLRHEDVLLVSVPMTHCGPLYSYMPVAAYLGATLAITPETKVKALAEIVNSGGVTVWPGVPTLFHQLATAKSVDDSWLAGVRVLAYAGSPMRPETIRRLRARWGHLALHNFFGLTETISITHVLPSPDALSHADSVGKLCPEVHARIVDDEGADVPPGEVGELCFHRANVVRGYWGRPGFIDKSFLDDESGDWFRTGDLASRDEDGYFYIRGRSKDMIITAGENVYAEEVEQTLARHPDVEDVAVVGVPATGVRASLGELVKAVIVPAEGSVPAPTAIKRFAFEHLASYKVPQIVEFRDKLPRNPSGKVLKDELRRADAETSGS